MVKSKKRTFAVTVLPVFLSILTFFAFGCYLIFYSGVPEANPSTLEADVKPIEADTLGGALPVHVQTDSKVSHPARLEGPESASYPVYAKLLDVITSWNPDNPDAPKDFKETLQHFDYSNPEDMIAAAKFRDAEVPFKVYNVPEIEAVAKKWDDEYLTSQFRNMIQSRHVEKSKNNHFMYWNGNQRSNIKAYEPPTEIVDDMKFENWVRIAHHADEIKVRNESVHFYFMANAQGNGQMNSFISRDIPIFSTQQPNFFVTNVEANKGIQCRFGMRGIIAEAHYDSGRNMVAMIKGAKRYILNPPYECDSLDLIKQQKHPSYRHSMIDWSDIEQAKSKGFDKVDAIDTVVQTGEVLYIPSYWFHYIVSLKYSVQCNTRSGSPPNSEGQEDIELCLGEKMNLRK
jgi:Cupin-like domain